MKKVVALIAAVTLLLCAVPLPTVAKTLYLPNDTVVFFADKKAAEAGSNVDISVNINGSYSANILNIFLNYDADTLSLNAEPVKGEVWSDVEASGGSAELNTAIGGRIGFIAILPQGSFGTEGTVFKVSFHVFEDAENGAILPITVEVSQFSFDDMDGTSHPIQFTAADGSITVLPCIPDEPVVVSIENVNAEPDSDVEVRLQLAGAFEANVLNLFIDYDQSAVSLNGEPQAGEIWTDIELDGGTVAVNTAIDGRIGFIAIMPEGAFGGNGTVFTMSFHVDGSVSLGTVLTLTPDVVQFSYDDMHGMSHAIPNTTEAGCINVQTAVPVTVGIDDAEAAAGDDVTIEVTLTGDYRANILNLFVDYNSTVLSLNNAPQVGEIWTAIEAAGGTVLINSETDGRIGFIALLPEGTFSATGTLFTLEFHIAENAEPGASLELELNVAQFSLDDLSGSSSTVPFTAENGNITIAALQPSLIGDVDCNGVINAIDALMALRLALGSAQSTVPPQGVINADVNANGTVDAVDALTILRWALAS